MNNFNLDAAIRKIADFPKKGILFYDITSILTNPPAFMYCIEAMVDIYRKEAIDGVAAIDSRGFLFAAPFCLQLGLPLMLVRKKGRLPGKTISRRFELEYGQAEVEMHNDDIPKGGRVLIVDDLIATGGTVKATVEILAEGGAKAFAVFAVIGLPFLHYKNNICGIRSDTLIEYKSEGTNSD